VLTGKPSDALDVFKNAIAAVEAGADDEAAPEGDAEAADAAGDRAATPEELEFEDDDGTMYRWDSKLRKYVPAAEADAAAAAAAAAEQHAYDVEAMTFVAEEEVIPTLAAARAAEEAAAAALEGKPAGGNKVCTDVLLVLAAMCCRLSCMHACMLCVVARWDATICAVEQLL
jgi:HIV Tat-specific factor 1